MEGKLIKYTARGMRMFLTIRLEGGEEVEVSLSDDVLMAMASAHERVSYSHVDENLHTVPVEAEEITSEVEDGRIVNETVVPCVDDTDV